MDVVLLRHAATRARTSTNLERRLTELEKAQISQRIKDARVQAGLTQEELADLLHVRVRTLANYESTRVPFRLIDQIAEFTGVTQEWLLTGGQPAGPAAEEDIAALREEVADVQSQLGRIEDLVRRLVELQERQA